MQRIQIGDTHVLTGDRTANALFEYARVLASAGLTDSVQIPTVDLRGVAGTHRLSIDPAAPFFAIPVFSQGQEPVDQALVAELRARIRRIEPDFFAQLHADTREQDLAQANSYDEILDLL